MADVSRYVRSGLAKTPVAGAHPDAGLLTAFVERSLPAREREQVLAHLATCVDCREVVALAAPELPAAAPAAAAPRRRWLPIPGFSMKTMRWAPVVAAVAVVTIAVVLQAPRVAQMNKEAATPPGRRETFAAVSSNAPRQQAGAKPAAAQEADRKKAQDEALAGARQNGQRLAEDRARRDAGEAALGRVAPAPPPPPDDGYAYSGKAAGGALAAAPERSELAMKSEPAKQKSALQKPPTQEPAVPKPALQKKDSSEHEEAKLAQAAPSARIVAAPAVAAPAAEAPATADDYSVAADRASAGSSAGGAASAAQYGPAFGAAGMQPSAPPPRPAAKPALLRWSVTSDGRVQRSADGRTWVYVPIAADVRFRALASYGDEVWVGGSNTALYRSADAGNTWQKVSVARLTGDIIRIVLGRDAVVLTTSSGQTMEMTRPEFGASPQKKAVSPR